jgi:hypothetical protein
MRRLVRVVSGVVVLAMSAMSAYGQAFAVFSPEEVKQIAAQKDSAVGLKFVRDANGELKDDPHPMERVHTEGTLAHQGIRDESQAAERDWDKMLNFAMAYRLTGDSRYLAAADRFLAAWMSVYHASFNPIDETNLDKVMMQGNRIWNFTASGIIRPAPQAWKSHGSETRQKYFERQRLLAWFIVAAFREVWQSKSIAITLKGRPHLNSDFKCDCPG